MSAIGRLRLLNNDRHLFYKEEELLMTLSVGNTNNDILRDPTEGLPFMKVVTFMVDR